MPMLCWMRSKVKNLYNRINPVTSKRLLLVTICPCYPFFDPVFRCLRCVFHGRLLAWASELTMVTICPRPFSTVTICPSFWAIHYKQIFFSFFISIKCAVTNGWHPSCSVNHLLPNGFRLQLLRPPRHLVSFISQKAVPFDPSGSLYARTRVFWWILDQFFIFIQ